METPSPKPLSESALPPAETQAEHQNVRRIVTDYNAPGMREEIARQMALLRDSPEEKDVMEWLEAIQAEDGWPE